MTDDIRESSMSSKLASLANHRSGAFQGELPLVVPTTTSPFDPPAPRSAPRPSAGTARTNQYAADCVRCGARVEAGRGLLSRGSNGWVVTHMANECVKVTSEPEAPAGEQVPQIIMQTGIYTVADDAGRHTFRVTIQKTDADFAPGKTILEFLSGSNNTHDYTSFAFVAPGMRLQVWKRYAGNETLVRHAQALLANPEAALESKTCCRCGEVLTVPESIARGAGPTCARIWGL